MFAVLIKDFYERRAELPEHLCASVPISFPLVHIPHWPCPETAAENGHDSVSGREQGPLKKFLAVRVGRPWHRVPILGSVPGQVGQGLEHPGLVEGVPAHGRGWNEIDLRSLPTQTTLGFPETQSCVSTMR